MRSWQGRPILWISLQQAQKHGSDGGNTECNVNLWRLPFLCALESSSQFKGTVLAVANTDFIQTVLQMPANWFPSTSSQMLAPYAGNSMYVMTRSAAAEGRTWGRSGDAKPSTRSHRVQCHVFLCKTCATWYVREM